MGMYHKAKIGDRIRFWSYHGDSEGIGVVIGTNLKTPFVYKVRLEESLSGSYFCAGKDYTATDSRISRNYSQPDVKSFLGYNKYGASCYNANEWAPS